MPQTVLQCFFIFLIMLGMTGCSGTRPPAIPSQTVSPTETPSLFAYTSDRSFDIRVVSETDQDGVTVIDLSFSTHDPAFSPSTAGRTMAYIVRPKGEGSFAGVMYLHWLGTSSSSNSSRSQYLEEAIALAQKGTVSLLVQGYYPWMTIPRADESDRQLIIAQVIELRRAMDFLLAQPDVDPDRIAVVGHDYGALYAGILSGVDRRAKTYVLIAGTPSFSDLAKLFSSLDAYQSENYLPLVQDLDPDQFVSSAAPASIFFQFSQTDTLVPVDRAEAFYDSASDPKKIGWYDDLLVNPHEMLGDAVREDRLDWLADQLGLSATP